MSCAVKLEPKETISTVVSGKDVLVMLPTGFWKSLIFQVLVLMKEIMTGKLQVLLSYANFNIFFMIKWNKHP